MSTQSHNVKLTAEISATSKGLVDALNQASSAINSTSSNWKSKFDKLKDSTSVISQGVKNLGDLMKNVGDIDPSSMSTLTNAIGEVSTNFDKVKGEVDAFVQKMSELKIAASNLGMPIEEYQAFADAVKASDVDMGEASNMLSSMQQQILNLANGVPEVQSLFDRLGVTLEQVSSNTVGANFQLLVNALNDTIPASERATQNMQLFKSSIDSTLKVAQQYQKTVSEQTGTYATDKDVQNAISLSSAIEKLGRQLGEYATGMNGAGNATRTASQALAEYANNGSEFAKVLDDTLKAYEKFSDSLSQKPTATGDFFSRITEEVSKLEDALKAEKLPIEEFKDKLDKFVDFTSAVEDKLDAEFNAISGIMSQRIASGAPIDTTELDNAIKGFNRLKDATDRLKAIWRTFSDEMKKAFKYELKSGLEDFSFNLQTSRENCEDLSREISVFNTAFDINNGNKQLEEFNKELKEAEDKLSKKLRINVDTTKVDTAIKKLREMLDEQPKEHTASDQSYGASASTVMGQVRALEFVRERFVQINAESEKQQVWWRRIGRSIGDAYRRLMGYKDGVRDARKESENLGTTFAKGIGQMMGMGSAVATVTLAMRKLVDLAKEYVKQLLEAKEAMSYGNLAQGADSMTEARTKSDSRYQKLIEQAKEYADLVHEERETGSRETRAKRINLGEQLLKQYGLDLKQAPNRGDIDKEIATKLDEFTKKRLKAIDSQLKVNQRLENGADEFIDGMQGFEAWGDMLHSENWKGYFKQIGYTFKGDVNGANAIKEAQEKSDKAKQQDMELMEERRRLSREDLSAQFLRIRSGKEADKTEKERKEAEEKMAKELEGASQKIEEWKNSLTDTDRQQNIRSIMEKYQELIDEGADHKEAENVATLAIAKMLQKEREEEDKKNKELLKALEDRIKAYKDAYSDYLKADKEVRDAKRQYAQTQKDLAREDRAERVSKRRERLQKAMGRFGFQPYEGFSLNESSSERRERRRNSQLDASIAEKLAKSQAGGRVHFTHAEKERLQAFEKLQKQDKRLEAVQKQMEASEKQKKASEDLMEAARAIREAIYGRKEASRNLTEAGRGVREASSKRRKRSQEDTPELIFENARKSLNARGVSSSYSTKTIDYSTQLGTLHTDLQKIMQKTYLVR